MSAYEITTEVQAFVPNSIAEDSWLCKSPRYDWFLRGYAYAQTQTAAIPALSAVPPETLYHATWAILRGAGLPDPEEVPTWRYECGCRVQGGQDNIRPTCAYHGKPLAVGRRYDSTTHRSQHHEQL